MNAPIAWRSVAPEDWPYLADLLGTDRLPIPRCGCRCCLNAPSVRPPLENDVADEPRRALREGLYGARHPGERSRMDRLGGPYVFLTVAGRVEAFPMRTGERYERPSRANFEPPEEPARLDRRLTDKERADVLERLESYTARRSVLLAAGGREDWMHEVFLEIEQPPADVEQPNDLEIRIVRAAWRVDKHFAKQVRSLSLPRPFLHGRGIPMAIDDTDDVLTDDEQARLTTLVEVHGEVRAAEHLKLSRTAVLRLLAKRPVRYGTIAAARLGLAKRAS